MKITTLATAIALMAGAAQAQDIYAGVSFDYGNAQSGDDQTAASLLIGGGYDIGAFTVGAEAEYGASATFGGDYDTARLRLIGAFGFGNMTGLASIGGTQFSTDGDNLTGYNFGLGLQTPITNSLDIRGELIRDMMDDSDFNTTTSRVAAIYSF